MSQRLSLGLPSWFGKLPGIGDFAYRRMNPHFQSAWDDWLRQGLMRLRTEVSDWVTPYLNAPIWFFALGKNVIGSSPWVGVMMPSVDSVGRYFPLTLVSKLPETDSLLGIEAHKDIAAWWSRCAQLASAALHHDLDANTFDSILQSEFAMMAHDLQHAPTMQTYPSPGYSSWIASASDQALAVYMTNGLPTTQAFSILFGSDEEATNAAPLQALS